MSSAENFTHSAKHEIQANRAMRKYMLGRKRIVTMTSRKQADIVLTPLNPTLI